MYAFPGLFQDFHLWNWLIKTEILKSRKHQEGMSAPPPPPPPSSSWSNGIAGSSSDQHEPHHNGHSRSSSNDSSFSEIEEELISDEVTGGLRLPSIREGKFEGLSSTASLNGEDNVYVTVGKSESSMAAVSWALRNMINSPSTVLVLIHIYPETHYIPYPLGRIQKSQASAEQVQMHMAQERGKKRELLKKFINACSASKVKVETVLIESDMVGKAIIDLIPILNIRRLVFGVSKSRARKLKAGRGDGITEQVLKSPAVDTCDVKVICEGKEVETEKITESPSPGSNGSSSREDDWMPSQQQNQPSDRSRRKEQPSVDPFGCFRFKPKTIG